MSKDGRQKCTPITFDPCYIAASRQAPILLMQVCGAERWQVCYGNACRRNRCRQDRSISARAAGSARAVRVFSQVVPFLRPAVVNRVQEILAYHLNAVVSRPQPENVLEAAGEENSRCRVVMGQA